MPRSPRYQPRFRLPALDRAVAGFSRWLSSEKRVYALFSAIVFLFLIVAARLWYLQVIQYDHYLALSSHAKAVPLQAKRGEIRGIDYYSGQYYTLATTTTNDLFYIDPSPKVMKDKPRAAREIAPLVFAMLCEGLDESNPDALRIARESCVKNVNSYARIDSAVTEQELLTLDTAWDVGRYQQAVEAAILRRISQERVLYSRLANGLDAEKIAAVQALALPGVTVTEDGTLSANPTEVPNARNTARALARVLDIDDESALEYYLRDRELRYVPIARRIPQSFSARVKQLKEQNEDFGGFVLTPEHWRQYPEGPLLSQVLGYVDKEFRPRYGLEEYYESELHGKDGVIVAQTDVAARYIAAQDAIVQPAEDGKNIYISIDRVIQKKVEEYLAETVNQTQSRSGTVVVIDPNNGNVIAMAHYPTFDPNFFGEGLDSTITDINPGRRGPILETYQTVETQLMPVADPATGVVTMVEQQVPKNKYKIYKNLLGSGAYFNRAVASLVEPGSVIKPFTMAAAIDTGEVEPLTRAEYDGPLELDEFISSRSRKIVIRNHNNIYFGKETMIHVIEQSSNVGIAWVADRLGPALVYDYLTKFGFGRKTGIQLPGELPGVVENWESWSRARLINNAFGQGMSSTPLQVAMAYAALANGGELLRPRLVTAIENPNTGERTEVPRQVVRRVVKESTARTITSMLTSVSQNGSARLARIPGYQVAAKTGTSQIARTDGPGYETGDATTIASLAGYAPASRPAFVMTVTIERPLTTPNGSSVAGPLFGRIGAFILDYYNIPKDEK